MVDALLDKWDIYYVSPVGIQMGFMLAKNKQLVKAWSRVDERGLPESYAPGDIGYANLSPDVQKVIAQVYLHGGIGALQFESEEDEAFQRLRYLRSKNIDLRCKGKAYLGPKVTTMDIPSAAGGSSSYTAKIRPNGAGSETAILSQYPGTGAHWDKVDEVVADDDSTYVWNSVRGWQRDLYVIPNPLPAAATITKVEVFFRCKGSGYNNDVRARSAIKTHDTVYDGTEKDIEDQPWTNYSQVYTNNPNTSAAWTVAEITALEIGVSLKSPAAGNGESAEEAYCTQVWVEVSYDLTGAELSTGLVVFNDKVYGYSGTKLSRLNTAGTAFELFTGSTFASNISDIEIWGDYLFIALGYANKYYYMDTGENFTQSGLTNGEADKFRKVGIKLAQLKLPNKVRFSTNPLNGGSWGSEIKVGEASFNVNDLLCYQGLLYCMKEDGPYYIDSSDNPQQPFPSLITIANTDSGKASDIFLNKVYYRMGVQKVFETDISTNTELTPSLFAPGIQEYAYPVIAFAHDETWLYAIMKRGDNDLALMAARWEYIAGSTRWVWHEIRDITLPTVSAGLVASVEGRPYLYLTSGEQVAKVYLPITSDATADSDYRYCTSGSLWTARYTTLLQAYEKKWDKFFARNKNLSSTKYINVYQSTDDGASFALLGKMDTSPEQTLDYASGIEETMMNLRLDFVSNSDSVSPVLKYFNIFGILLMPPVVRFWHTIKCADNLWLKHQFKSKSTITEIVAFINSIRSQICTLGDRDGNEHTVKVRVAKEVEAFDEESGKPERQFQIEAVKL